MPPRDLRGRYDAQATGIVEAREIDPPAGVEPAHWVLLTGTRIEDTQLSTAQRIQALLAFHAVVAVELLRLKFLARTSPDATVGTDVIAAEMLEVLAIQVGRPASGWTYASAIRAIARMGGYLGRKNDGPPGWLSIWRGYKRLMLITEGYVLALQQKTCGQ